MLTMTNTFNAAIKSPVRTVQGKVDLYYKSGTSQSTKIATYTQDDFLKSIKIERIADEGKFFGFGVSHKVNIKLRDVNRELDIRVRRNNIASQRCFFILYLGTGNEYVETQRFYITETHRNENTNELSITAYDALYFTTAPIGDLVTNTMDSYIANVMDIIKTTNNLLIYNGFNGGIQYINCTKSEFTSHNFKEGANFESTSTCREVLDDIAEATHTIYYIDKDDKFVFKRPDRDGAPVLTITRSDYITLKNSDNRRFAKFIAATELGDNVSAQITESGTTQIIRDNGFFTMMSSNELTAAIDKTIADLGGLTVNQFECSWRGNPALEPGDKIGLITKDGDTVFSFLYSDTIEYDGTLSQKSEWKYTADEAETESTPTSLGEVIKQVYAKVDRVNKEISLVVSEKIKEELANGSLSADIEGIIDEKVSKIEIDTESIESSVMEKTQEIIDNELAEIREETSMKVTKDEVEILIEEAISDGINEITTSTGFTFNEEGLTISKSDSEIQTTITEDGMYIKRENEEVLTVDNEGVKAEDLHATTYLIIGVNSRFEDYDRKRRTGCFWIGK